MNILIVDDHPMVAAFYETVLLESFTSTIPQFIKAFNCEQAYNAITSTAQGSGFELAILDYRLPAYEDKLLFDGCDLAKLTRERNPNCKIFLITAQAEVLIVYDILKKIHPEGLAVKNDIDTDNFSQIVTKVLEGNFYQSKTVRACTSKIWQEEIMIDDDNRKIVFNLAKGYKVKELETVVNLSSSTIQKRIINIKKNLGLPADSGLILELTKRGFL